nr:SUN domain-containing protein 2 [Ciona intestinalis]|eukprot:XP_002122724.1 SUN domain-containing protein 2 [Ciona intestinalis]
MAEACLPKSQCDSGYEEGEKIPSVDEKLNTEASGSYNSITSGFSSMGKTDNNIETDSTDLQIYKPVNDTKLASEIMPLAKQIVKICSAEHHPVMMKAIEDSTSKSLKNSASKTSCLEMELRQKENENQKLVKLLAKLNPDNITVVSTLPAHSVTPTNEVSTNTMQQVTQLKEKLEFVENLNRKWQKYSADVELKSKAFAKDAQEKVTKLESEKLSLQKKLQFCLSNNDQMNENLSDLGQELQRSMQREQQLRQDLNNVNEKNELLANKVAKLSEDKEEAETALIVAMNRPSTDTQTHIWREKLRQQENYHQKEIGNLRRYIVKLQQSAQMKSMGIETSGQHYSAPPRLPSLESGLHDVEADSIF